MSKYILYGIAAFGFAAAFFGFLAAFDVIPGIRTLLTAQIGETASQASQAPVGFYMRLILIGLVAVLALFGIFVGVLFMMRNVLFYESRDLLMHLKKLELEITERDQRLRIATEREAAKSKEISRLKDEFIFIAAHELRAPVAAIEGNLSLFLNDKEALGKVSQEYLEVLQDVRIAAERLSRLVIDLLNVARIEAGTIRIAFERTNVAEVILDTIREIEPSAKQVGVRLVFDEQELVASPPVMGDAQRLREVFLNIFSNAIKYNVSGGMIAISIQRGAGHLTIAISDTGVGIGEDELAHLFTKFWRANPSIEGTGLGLWITKQIVEKMRGSISAESVKGKGSTFRVSLKMLGYA